MTKRFSLRDAAVTAVAVMLGLAFAAAPARAQVTKDDAGCRAAIQKAAGKLGATAMKTVDGCVKSQLKGPSGVNCNDPTAPAVDTKGKVTKAASKVTDAVAKKCTGTASATALASYASCPSPANTDDDGGATTEVDTFVEVGACEITLNTRPIEALRGYILNPDAAAIVASPNAKDIAKCANAIAKGATKLWATVSKERGKCQASKDKAGLPYAYSCSTADDKGKIAGAVSKLGDGIAKKCTALSPAELGLIHTCDTDVSAIAACVASAVKKNAGGATANAFEFAGVCPVEVRIASNSGSGDGTTVGVLTKTNLDAGWTGLGHHTDIVDGFVGRVNLSCSDETCSSCTVTTNCEAGNCRCSNNAGTVCGAGTGPFTQDVCGVGNTCIVHFGPPLALSAGGNPTCVTNTISQELVGTADVGTGESTTQVNDVAKVFLGISQSQPCPTCSGATIGAAGNCNGGANNGAACVTNAIHPDFGGTSYQCQPSLAQNISGSGLKVNLALTDGHVSLAPGDPCESPLGGSSCWCGVCSGDATVTCNSDADCAGMALGTCGKGAGADRRPNQCGDLSCEDGGNEEGFCNGDQDKYCSGFLRKNGGGVITCSVDADCDALDPECPGGNCGDCATLQTRRCFLDPIEATGLGGQDGAELVSTFCSGPTTNAGINLAGGIPGPGRVIIDWDFIGYCPEATCATNADCNGGTCVATKCQTEYELGGSNCP